MLSSVMNNEDELFNNDMSMGKFFFFLPFLFLFA